MPASTQGQPAAAPATLPQGQLGAASPPQGPDCFDIFSSDSSALMDEHELMSIASNAAEEVAAGPTSPPGSPPTAGPTSPQGQPAAAPAQAGHDSSDARSTISISTVTSSFLLCDSGRLEEFSDIQSVAEALPNDSDPAAGPACGGPSADSAAVSSAQLLPSESTPAGEQWVLHLRGGGEATCSAGEKPEYDHPLRDQEPLGASESESLSSLASATDVIPRGRTVITD